MSRHSSPQESGRGRGRTSRRCAAEGEAGFSLIELIVALGLFSLLMVIVTGLSIAALRGISEASRRAELQVQSQNAMEWISRLVRYADVPDGGTTAIEDASATGLTAYSYSGTGEISDAPYRIRLFTEPGPDDSTVVVSEVTTPVRTADGWAWTGQVQQRRLLSLPARLGTEPLSIEYFVCDPDDCSVPSPYTPTGTGPLLAADSPLVPAYLQVSLGDPNLPDTQVTQMIDLVNLR